MLETISGIYISLSILLSSIYCYLGYTFIEGYSLCLILYITSPTNGITTPPISYNARPLTTAIYICNNNHLIKTNLKVNVKLSGTYTL